MRENPKRKRRKENRTCVTPAAFPKYPGAGASAIDPMIEGRTTTARSFPAACASATASSARCLVNVYALGNPNARRIGVAILSAAEADGAARILAMVPAWSSLCDDDDDDKGSEEEEEEEDEEVAAAEAEEEPEPEETTSLR